MEWRTKVDIRNWEKTGKQGPPPHAIKRMIIREYQKNSNYKILVETGTYFGDMIYAQMDYFESIYSIELSKIFYDKAVKRFRKYKKIHLLYGDSSVELGLIVKEILQPAIFWLDGHYSGGLTAKGASECPIVSELNQIFANGNLAHIILIDDARCFIGENDYPTIEELQRYFIEKNINHSFEVKDDVIRIVMK
jgi:hypothetical protein